MSGQFHHNAVAPSLRHPFSRQLSTFFRLYVYGLHGYFTEVMFTALWDLIANANAKLAGCSSVWSLFIYALSCWVIEVMYLRLEARRVPMLLRGLIYLTWIYVWEFSTGWFLGLFGACPWDYTPLPLNLFGLITFEYAPLWYASSLVLEQVLVKNLLRLRWMDGNEEFHRVFPGNNLVNGYAYDFDKCD
ncbi:transmembrane protein 229B-like [Ornithodoros turicata]|uniref:transmembrane protein 229B-like n=1 Tax=Ornithodoros turicata TaxID=34597 RepID=UPI00313961B7